MARSAGTFKKGRPKTGGRRPGSLNRVTLAVRDAARLLVEDPSYRAALRSRLIRGRAPEIEKTLWHYAYGKPPSYAEMPPPAPPRPTYDLSVLDPEDIMTMPRIHAKLQTAARAKPDGLPARPPGPDPARPLASWKRGRPDPPRV
jgi:hypothetical protein